jgi:3-oxoacyl-[acyl-carrier protein] reductase
MRTVLIPGGARGIGRAVALRCLRKGWAVSVCHRSTPEDADSLMREAGDDDGDRLLVTRRDVSIAHDRDALVDETLARFGTIDALVHAAGPFVRAPVLASGVDPWRDAWESNVAPLIALCSALVPAMSARGWGRVVGFGTAGVERLAPAPSLAAWGAAKASLVAFVRALARDVARDGVTANVVSPGVIDTGGVEADVIARQLAQVPIGRVGTPDEAAAMVCFLLRDEAAYITGQNVTVSGGRGL